ncbi:hypothetical protein FOL47_009148 [Perkinsus chesapeaki]|uniref:Tetratricopeptide repeat protein 29 n=1 Tax=Perkinsus chesapeaki TaxID=330153 RepID=A0A7J6MSA3_PERCH|nr:hypothetical protein FOL47_009148 [Perkinsus chesapeaki]
MTEEGERIEEKSDNGKLAGHQMDVLTLDIQAENSSNTSVELTSKGHASSEDISLELLLGGYPQSFIDFTYFTQRDENSKMSVSSSTSVNLSYLSSGLSKAEEHLLGGQRLEALRQYSSLADYLHEEGDLPAALYFCNRSANLVDSECDASVASEAFYKLGSIKAELQDLMGAIVVLEHALDLASGPQQDAASVAPISYKIAADLATLYLRLAGDDDFFLGNPSEEIEQSSEELVVAGREWSPMGCYQRALECGKLSCDEAVEGAASYKLGVSMVEAGMFEEALPLQRRYLDISQHLGHLKNEAAARAELGKIYQKLGDRDAAIVELEHLEVVAEKAGEITLAADACLDLSVLLFNEEDRRATSLLEKYYNLASKAGDHGRQGNAAVLVGLARGYDKVPHVADIFQSNGDIYRLLDWKDASVITQ